MDFSLSLNQDSVNRIQQILLQMRLLPHYDGCNITFDNNGGAGSHVIDIYKNGNFLSGYYFYPQPFSGKIGSIAIYGVHLNGHYNTISASKKVFGFDVESIELVTDGAERFVDIEISY